MKNNLILILISFLTLNIVNGQEFQYISSNPFGLQFMYPDSSKIAIRVLFHDLDTDGDQDAVLVGIDFFDDKVITYENIHYFIETQENIGDRWSPSFSNRKPFMANFPFPNGFFYPAIGDINHDGMADLIVSSRVDSFLNLELLYYRRKSNFGDEQFEIKGADFLELDFFPKGSFMVPAIGDMDMDGDPDLLMSGFITEIDEGGNRIRKPIFLYAKNTGSRNNPTFVGWYQNPYGLANTIDEMQMVTVGDVDNDNDNDIISLTTLDTFTILNFYENNPLENGKANFTSFSSLLGLPVANSEQLILPPSLVDIDGDGDLDLFMIQELIEKVRSIGFYENQLCTEIMDNTISQIGSIIKANLGGVKYQWYDCTIGADIAGATTQTFQPAKSGKYAVKLDNDKGCENISLCYNFVISATTDQILSNQITIYPNPTDDYFTIENNTEYTISSVIIRNNTGQMIKYINSNLSEKIGTADLPDGIYSLEITLGQWKVHKNLIIVDSRK